MHEKMRIWAIAVIALLIAPALAEPRQHRIFVVSSYHRDYLWSRDTQKGLCAGLLEFGFLASQEEADELTRTDYIDSRAAVVKKAWMDTKRKNSRREIAVSVNRIMEEIERFAPNLVLLGDDNAANHIGNQLIDTDIPVVFWGINGLPLKYELLDSLERPGHNVTGVYQAGYLKDCLEFLKRVVPGTQTFAVLSDDSETGRSKAKELANLAASGELPLALAESVMTNDLNEWKAKAIELKDEVDAFFILNHNSLKDERGRPVDQLEIGAWYLRHIKLPECAQERQFAQEGMLCVCDDSGYNQGYEAMKLGYAILKQGRRASDIPVEAPGRGPLIVNRARARMLGLTITEDMGVEQYIDASLALERRAASR